MLTTAQLEQHCRRRPPPSLQQLYQEYMLQRIEGFKNSIPREELLRLGDEAVSELAATSEGQFVLTEVLMLESVDRLIVKRLALRSYRRWRQHYVRLRAAQQEPAHWSIDPHCPAASVLPRLEPGDTALAIGPATEPYAYLLAAHDVAVTFIAGELGCVERVESRAMNESLGSHFVAYLVELGRWLPEIEHPLNLVVLDTAAVSGLASDIRLELLRDLQTRTEPGGVHIILPGTPALAPDSLLSLYPEWHRERRVADRRRGGGNQKSALALLMNKPLSQTDTAENVSELHSAPS